MRCGLTIAACFLAGATLAGASQFEYTGPELDVDYRGPVLVDNSHFLYTNEDIRSFDVASETARRSPGLQPVAATIRTWASLQGIHPRVLILMLDRYWNGNEISGSRQDVDVVYEITAGLAQVFWSEVDDPLAATRAVVAVADAYGLVLDLPEDLAVRRELPVPAARGTVDAFGYFQPPWQIGETWWGGGAHGNTGGATNMNALDWAGRFGGWGTDYSDIWVAAMQGGTLNVLAECSAEVLHEDGWRTSYYHLENPQFEIGSGTSISRDTVLANIANDEATALCQGGGSTGPHVHTAMWRNGSPEIVDESNLDFTAFSQHSSTTPYDFDCETSWYNHYTTGIECPGSLSLLNDAPPTDGSIFADGFESGDVSSW